tara:strand:- start:242 stop:544 length:303 start_codon:yes stop_codon:yes gene_type:complete
MSLDHFAIYKAYSGIVHRISDDENAAYDKDDKKIELDQNKINAARTTLDSEFAATKYQRDRAKSYPSLADQLDMQYWDKKNGTTTWVDAISKVKSDNPKP